MSARRALTIGAASAAVLGPVSYLTVLRVEVLDPPRAFAIQIADQNWAWIFALVPEGGSTRLISRNRIATSSLSPATRLGYTLFMEPGSLVMKRKMLLGIKQRAEHAIDG